MDAAAGVVRVLVLSLEARLSVVANPESPAGEESVERNRLSESRSLFSRLGLGLESDPKLPKWRVASFLPPDVVVARNEADDPSGLCLCCCCCDDVRCCNLGESS